MKLENQVCSLELAKKLKELKVKQESLFYWLKGSVVYKTPFGFVFPTGAETTNHNPIVEECISAYTCGELGEMLPASIEIDGKKGIINTFKDGTDHSWYFWYSTLRGVAIATVDGQFTEADCRGKMLCYLLENKLI